MLSQYPPRPRLTRLDTKHGSLCLSSSPSTSTSMSSPSPAVRLAEPLRSNQPQIQTEYPSKCLSARSETLYLEDLELMMHWCTTTYKSMARDSTSERIWQTLIPRLSLRYPALRQGLLALSALHLASTNISSHRWRYLDTARAYQAQALEGLQAETDDVPEAQSQATFALCCIMIIFTFGFCQIDRENDPNETQPDNLDEFFEVFRLTRWLVSIMMRSIDPIARSELRPLVKSENPAPTMPDMSRLVIFSLLRQNSEEETRNPDHETKTYDSAIGHLSNALKQLMNGEPSVFAFSWSVWIPVEFLGLLEARRPFALVILAHYAVILHHLRDLWWMGDWGTRILEEIGDLLGPEWQQLINWPIDATGCFLPRTEARVRVRPPVRF